MLSSSALSPRHRQRYPPFLLHLIFFVSLSPFVSIFAPADCGRGCVAEKHLRRDCGDSGARAQRPVAADDRRHRSGHSAKLHSGDASILAHRKISQCLFFKNIESDFVVFAVSGCSMQEVRAMSAADAAAFKQSQLDGSLQAQTVNLEHRLRKRYAMAQVRLNHCACAVQDHHFISPSLPCRPCK